MMNSLPRRIAVLWATVIATSLLIAGALFVYGYLSEYQTKLTNNRLANAAGIFAALLGNLPATNSIPRAQLSEMATGCQCRAMVASLDGKVLYDTGDASAQEIPALAVATDRVMGETRLTSAFAGVTRSTSGVEYSYVSVLYKPDRFGRYPYNFALVVADETPTFFEGLREIAPALGAAGAIALLLSAPLVAFLAKSISRPVRLMTLASAEMAEGNYNQQIPVTSTDELGRLSASFNTMAREVHRSNRALRDLIGNVSHELKTPLTSIQGFSQALLDGLVDAPDERHRAVSIIHGEANRMRRLVDDLLYISRLESGQIKLAREPVDLDVLLREVARRLAWQIEQKSIALRLPDASRLAVLGDAHRLDGVFGNLLENAVRHTPNGGQITVSSTTEGSVVAIAVHNTGSHIPLAEQSRIFERFYQIDRSRATSGAGLGLAIAWEVVQAHGGQIAVNSPPSDGVTFTVKLTLAPMAADAGYALAAPAAEPARPTT